MRNTENNALAEKGYNPFLTNRSLSYHHDTVAVANEMNMRSDLPKLLQYEFFLNTIRSKKRFAKWDKREDHGDLTVVKEYFGYSDNKAAQALTVLTDDQIIEIRKRLEKGGRNA